jgi:hypothetical protein
MVKSGVSLRRLLDPALDSFSSVSFTLWNRRQFKGHFHQCPGKEG